MQLTSQRPVSSRSDPKQYRIDNLVDGHLVWISKPAQNAHLPGRRCPVTGIRRTIFLVIKHSSFNGAEGTSRGPIQADGRQNSSSSGKETPGGNNFIN